MKRKGLLLLAVALMILSVLTACGDTSEVTEDTISLQPQSHGQIYLYGEQHGIDAILEKEFEIWNTHYHDDGMRQLFVEIPYYSAELLNIWLKSDNDDILNALYDDWVSTAARVPAMKDFYKRIQAECPETIFHGTDVGHQYGTTGKRFLESLEQNGLKDSEQYSLTQENIEQGEYYYGNSDDFVYRENKMTENFIREFDLLAGESIMGIYGVAHTGLGAMDTTGTIPCMANQLKEHYGDIIQSEDLSVIAKDIEPYRTDTISIDGKDYEASYFGDQDISSFGLDYVKREFWRLEGAYDDFKDNPKPGDVLPYDNYPMIIEAGQVFVIDYTKPDGSVTRMYYRFDEGYIWNDKPSTEQFVLE